MNQYFTEVEIKDIGWHIDHRTKVMMMGSCFSENIGQRMKQLKFQVDLNPFGILYNPQSVSKSIRLLMEQKTYTAKDLIEHDGIWHSFDHHSRFSSTNKENCLKRINDQIRRSYDHLIESEYLILSLGTAWVFELKNSGKIVSNCHKLAAAEFNRYRLTPSEIVDDYRELISQIRRINSNLKILFTVSPIRHWKDGAVENQLSKSTLLLAINQLIIDFGTAHCAYFPSYEIVMDELRDYRFYAPDMMHISAKAVDHIWDKFCSKMITDESHKIIKSIQKIIKAIEHRPRNIQSEKHQKFLLYNVNKINDLMKSFPFLNLANEKKYFKLKLEEHQSNCEQ
ncbi:GSCFA domain-containing protein [uncultured Sunxiuqinia sp.]|uniref:GSCFA domain-containing protein n=1 Tax=uncultured Sunxiuqinia sp. TaxID=1573825 RepID=UPI002AA60B1B|nr:GSCFA domain-containing protein [uncultured Sunxiuqinia sp.]